MDALIQKGSKEVNVHTFKIVIVIALILQAVQAQALETDLEQRENALWDLVFVGDALSGLANVTVGLWDLAIQVLEIKVDVLQGLVWGDKAMVLWEVGVS